MIVQKSPESAYPELFPPKWAETWGEDQHGLFADFVVSLSESRQSQTLLHKATQLFGGENKRAELAVVVQRFRWIAPGDFLMGSPESEPERFPWEQHRHKVTLTQGYWLADTAVTQQFWQLVIGKNPSDFKDNQNNPVENVSWNDCRELVKKLNKLFLDQLDGLVFRFPTEAEWEHACRAGTTTPFSFGETITSAQVNFDGSEPYNKSKKSEYRRKTIPVKSLASNPWGLYEVHGNVWEWCADAWHEHSDTQPMIDPYHSSDDNARRVIRGGSWIDSGGSVRSACRDYSPPDRRDASIGFRLALGHELKARSA